MKLGWKDISVLTGQINHYVGKLGSKSTFVEESSPGNIFEICQTILFMFMISHHYYYYHTSLTWDCMLIGYKIHYFIWVFCKIFHTNWLVYNLLILTTKVKEKDSNFGLQLSFCYYSGKKEIFTSNIYLDGHDCIVIIFP